MQEGTDYEDRICPPEVEVMLMPCSGGVDIIHLLKAFEAGADAVFVAGCHEGECHYLTGNIRAKKRVNKLKKDLAQMGLEPERLEMFNVGSAEGPKFAAICREMSERAHKRGPSPINREAWAVWLKAQQSSAH